MIHILVDSENKKGFIKIEGNKDVISYEAGLFIDGILDNERYATDFITILDERLVKLRKRLEEELSEYKTEDKNGKNDSCN